MTRTEARQQTADGETHQQDLGNGSDAGDITQRQRTCGLGDRLTRFSLATFSSGVRPFRAPEMQRKAPRKHGAKHSCNTEQAASALASARTPAGGGAASHLVHQHLLHGGAFGGSRHQAVQDSVPAADYGTLGWRNKQST